MMTPKGAQKAVARLSLMKYFPSDPEARAVLMEDLGGICESDEQADWLARRALDLCPEWPGMQALWQIYFSKFTPRTERQRGIDRVSCATAQFPAGVPSEIESGERQLLSGKEMLQIAGPQDPVAPVDPVATEELAKVVESATMPALPKYYARTPDEIRVHETLRRMYNELPEPKEKSA